MGLPIKFSSALILSVLLTVLLAGCGGNSRQTTSAATRVGKAVFTVTWPARPRSLARSRLVPDASDSIRVAITNAGASVAVQVVPRPSSGGSSTVTFTPLPVGSLTVTATAYPQADGTGTAQATATLPLTIQAGQTTPFSLTMASTVDHLQLTLPAATLSVGVMETAGVAGIDASGATVLLSPAKLQWNSSNSAFAGVDAAGKITGMAPGSVTISVVDTESGKSATASLAVGLQSSTAYQIDAAHSGHVVFGQPLAFPSTPTWSVDLGAAVSYPLIAGGMVYVMSTNGGVYALSKTTGQIVWGPTISGSRAQAYDRGKLFILSLGGTLRSYDAVTGQAGWSVQLPGQYYFDATPTAVNGIVYVGGAGDGGTLYAVDETSGAVLWTKSVENGDQSSPAISEDGVFVSYPCQVYKFDAKTGAADWHYNGPCDGGGGRTAAYAHGQVYVRDGGSGTIYDASSGAQTGTFSGDRIPALGDTVGYFQDGDYYQGGGTLRAINLTTHQTLWSFAGDGLLSSAPLLIDQTVIIGSYSGTVYALDAASGQTVWSGSAGAPIPYPNEITVSQPLTGCGAGEGYLVVAAGSRLTAWHIAGP